MLALESVPVRLGMWFRSGVFEGFGAGVRTDPMEDREVSEEAEAMASG